MYRLHELGGAALGQENSLLLYCNECEVWKILFELWVIDVSLFVNYLTLEVRWVSAHQFDNCIKLHGIHFLRALISLYSRALEV